jgi:hypothetical protein
MITYFVDHAQQYGLYDAKCELLSFTFIYLSDKRKVEEMTEEDIIAFLRNLKRDFIRECLMWQGLKRKVPKKLLDDERKEIVDVSNGKGAEWTEGTPKKEKERWVRRNISFDNNEGYGESESYKLFEFELKTDEIRDKANFVLNNLTQVELDLLMEVAKADNSKELGKRLGVKASTARKRKERLIKDRIKPMLHL